jgi:hypothetical protein
MAVLDVWMMVTIGSGTQNVLHSPDQLSNLVCQGWGRGFESLRPLQLFLKNSIYYADRDGAKSASPPHILRRGSRGEAVGSIS